MLPFEGAFYYDAAVEPKRAALNAFIRTSGWFGPAFINPFNANQLYLFTPTGIKASFNGGANFQDDTVLTALVTALDLARVFAVFHAMGIPLSVSLVTFAYLGAAMLGMALLIPGGVGVTEVSMAGLIVLLAPTTVPSLARSAVLIDRFLSYYLLVLIGAGFLVAYHRLRHAFA